MNLLFDHCTPRPLRRELLGHTVRTAFEMGWANLRNGTLLAEAARYFDAVITVDKNMRYQHDPATLPITVIVLIVDATDPDTVRPLAPFVLDVLATLPVKQMIQIFADGRVEPPLP